MKRSSTEWRRGVSPGIILAVLLVLLMVALSGCGEKQAATETAKPEATQGEKAQPASAKLADIECAQCHEMLPEVVTWMTSSHSKIACTKCHTNYDQKKAQMQAAHDAGNIPRPIRATEKIPGDTCKQCHSSNRAFSLPGDLIVPHELHDKARVGCTDCHFQVVHAAIAERNVIARPGFTNYADWTPQSVERVATIPARQPTMWVCLDCHKTAKPNTPCKACHSDPQNWSAPYHDRPDFLSIHGKEGRKNVDLCARCHANREGMKFADSGTGDKIIDFERATPLCYDCHMKRPAFHGSNFMSQHANAAKTKGLLNCFACHSIEPPKPGQNVTGTYCNNCHWFPVKKAEAPAQQQQQQKQQQQ